MMASMKLSLLLVLASTAFADTWTGTVVDILCKGKDLAGHTAKCAVSCAKGGYGLAQADGKFLKFDEAGNAKALAALKATTKEKDIKAKITGTIEDDVIQVQKIEIQ